MAQRALTVLSGLAKGKVFPLSADRVTVGRDDASTIVFDDNDISREHAVLTLAGDNYSLKDLQSRNGTRVNGQRIQEKLLVPGDRIQFGLVEARYEATQPAVPKPAPAVQVTVPQVRVAPPSPPAAPPPPRPAPPASPPPAPKPVVPSAEEQRLRAELSARVTRVEELTTQNQQLAGQVATLRQQLEQAQKPPTQLAEARQAAQQVEELTNQLRAAKEQAAAQLASVRQEADKVLARSGEQTARLEELGRQNQQLTAQLATAQQSLATQQKVAEDSAAELQKMRGELSAQLDAVRRELTTAQEQTAAQVAVARQEADRELAALRTELAETRVQAGRVADVSRQRDELSAQLTEQRQLTEREAARVQELTLAQAAAQAQLTGTRTDWEEARRRLAQSEQLEQQNRILATQLAALRMELGEVRKQLADRAANPPAPAPAKEPPLVVKPVRLAQPLTRLRETLAARPPVESEPLPAPPKPGLTPAGAKVLADERVAEFERVQSALRETGAQLEKLGGQDAAGLDLTEQKQNIATRLKALQARLTETVNQEVDKALTALRRVREDLAGVRADLSRLASASTSAGTAPTAEARPQRGGLKRWIAVAGGVAVVLVAASVMAWRGTRTPPLTTVAAVESDMLPVMPPEALATPYNDPKGRFVCQVPRGWTAEELPDEQRSRVKFVSGQDEIRVTSYGSDWPALRLRDDNREAENAITSLLRLDNQEGAYAEVMSRETRQVDQAPAYQMDMKLAVGETSWQARVVYYRQLGREHIIVLYIRSLDQEEYLKLALERFLTSFQSVGEKEQAALAAPAP